MNVYKLLNNILRLLDISDVRTINTLLRNNFNDKEKYKLLKKVFIKDNILASYELYGQNFPKKDLFTQFETESQPWQLKKPLRNSVKKYDFMFANYLCENGFDGYVAERMDGFHDEIMLCNPKKDLELLKEIHRTKFTKISRLRQAVHPYVN